MLLLASVLTPTLLILLYTGYKKQCNAFIVILSRAVAAIRVLLKNLMSGKGENSLFDKHIADLRSYLNFDGLSLYLIQSGLLTVEDVS